MAVYSGLMYALPSIWVTQVGILARESNSILSQEFCVIFTIYQRGQCQCHNLPINRLCPLKKRSYSALL